MLEHYGRVAYLISSRSCAEIAPQRRAGSKVVRYHVENPPLESTKDGYTADR